MTVVRTGRYRGLSVKSENNITNGFIDIKANEKRISFIIYQSKMQC